MNSNISYKCKQALKIFLSKLNSKDKDNNLEEDLENPEKSINNLLSNKRKFNSSPNFRVDPMNDYLLEKKYLTKFRMTNLEKLKLLSDRNKKMKKLNKKLTQQMNVAKEVDFIEVNELTDVEEKEKAEQKQSKKKFEEDSDGSISSDYLEEISEDEKDKIKNTSKVPIKESSINTNEAKNGNIKKDLNKNIKDTKEKEVNEKLEKLEKNKETKKNNLFSTLDNDLYISDDSEEDNLDDEENEDDEEDYEGEEFEDEEGEEFDYEEEEMYEGEGEEGEELEDDEDMEGYQLSNEDLKGLTPQELLFFQQLMNPPDFKKDLFKKVQGEDDNEVNYDNLKTALRNATKNMKAQKKIKNEFKKSNNNVTISLLGNKGKKNNLYTEASPSKNTSNSNSKKVAFTPGKNQRTQYDNKKPIILNSKYPRVMKLKYEGKPLKSCLKK